MSLFAPAIRALLEEGPYPLTAARLAEIVGGDSVTSGARVSVESSMGVTAVWACVRIISETLGMLPLHVYERLPEGGKERATEHPIYRLLHDEPNPWMTAMKFRETMQGHVLLRGNGYAEIERDRFGVPVALWPLRPDHMRTPSVSASGYLTYPYQHSDGVTTELLQSQVLHIRGLSSDGLIGYSPITLHRETVGLAMALREHGARLFGQGARPGGVLKTKGRLSTEAAERLKQRWQSAHGGLSMSHRVAVLEEGVEWQQIGMSQEDAQYLQTRAFTEQDITRIFRMPQHKAGWMTDATFSNIEKQAVEFVTDTMLPWLTNWDQQLSKDLLFERERQTYFVQHLVDGLLRGDTAARFAAYHSARLDGWMSGNEIREFENMNPMPHGGDDFWQPVNVVPAGTQIQPMQRTIPPQQQQSAELRLLLAGTRYGESE